MRTQAGYGRAVRVLVTNDDGIEGVGLHVLARALQEAGHEVLVVAPDGERSGSGAALGWFGPQHQLHVEPVGIPEFDGDAYALDAPPGLCVLTAVLGGFGDVPDVVVAGINPGLNTGRAILHSGTVGAALTAQNFGVRGLAVSVGDDADAWYFDTAAACALAVLDTLAAAPERTVLNLNVPALALDELAGIRWGRLAAFGAVRASLSRAGGDGPIQMELTALDEAIPADTDTGLCAAGFASLTTIVGVTEAWPGELASLDAAHEIAGVAVPGGPFEAVQRIPDFSDRATLHPRRYI